MNKSTAAATSHAPWLGPPAEPREMDCAQRVQAHLRASKQPRMKTLEFAGNCLPGRAVGGDFYDFLQPAPGRLA